MFTKKPLVAAAVIGATLSTASLAHAALITEWSFDVSNNWNEQATTWQGSGGTTAFETRNTLPNGQDPASAYNVVRWGQTGWGGNQSFLAADRTFTQSSLKTNDAAGAQGASYYHGNYEVSGRTLASTQLQTQITINSVSPAGTSIPISRTFDIDFSETANTETRWIWIFPYEADIDTEDCEGYGRWGSQAGGSVDSCPDRFTLDTANLSFTETIDDYLYTFTIAFDGMSNVLALTENGGDTEIWTGEGIMSTLSTRIYVTAEQIGLPPVQDVPEPGTIALLGFGLAAAGAGLRRRRR